MTCITANNILPATTPAKYTHALVVRKNHTVAYQSGLHRLYAFMSYDEALAAWQAVTDRHDGDKAMEFAVRSLDDPTLLTGISDRERDRLAPMHLVNRAVRKYAQAEVNETAKWIIRKAIRINEVAGTRYTWKQMEAMMIEALNGRVEVSRWDIEDALKARVRIARCHECRNGRQGWFWSANSKARVCDVRCPSCGSRVYQTTLSFRAPFVFIADPVATFFSTRPSLLPGEKNVDMETRMDRVHAAIEAENGSACR